MSRSPSHFDLLRQAKTACDTVKVTSSYDEMKLATRRIWAACNKLEKIDPRFQTYGIWGHISECKSGAAKAFDSLADFSRNTGYVARQMRQNAIRDLAVACDNVEYVRTTARGVHEMRKRDRRPMKQRRVES